MKHEETLKKAIQAFRDDDDDVLLRLAILKKRADYRGWFTVALRKTVESAYARIDEENTKGPGHFADEETENTLADFLGKLRYRFGIRYITIPPFLTLTAWLDVLDPAVDVKEIPPKVLRAILPRLFYTGGVWEVVPKSVHLPYSNKHPIEGSETTSPECAPYERLWKIDLRKKNSQLLREFKARLDSVDAQRGMKPEAYEAWEQDRSRKREEAWRHLEIWDLRNQRPKKSFAEVAIEAGVTEDDAKYSFYRAFGLIYGKPFNREAWETLRAKEPFRTCADCPQRETCKDPCPDIFEEKKSTDEYIPEDLGAIADAYSYQEYLTQKEDDET